MNVLRLCGFALFAALLGGHAMAQAPYEPPRATDGHPDLQGVWISRWITPLERHSGSDRSWRFLSKEETAAAEAAEWVRHNAIDPIEGTD